MAVEKEWRDREDAADRIESVEDQEENRSEGRAVEGKRLEPTSP